MVLLRQSFKHLKHRPHSTFILEAAVVSHWKLTFGFDKGGDFMLWLMTENGKML